MFLNINTLKKVKLARVRVEIQDLYNAMAAPVPKQRLYPSLDEVSGKRKHSNGKENIPVTPVAKRAKLLQRTPVRVRASYTHTHVHVYTDCPYTPSFMG